MKHCESCNNQNQEELRWMGGEYGYFICDECYLEEFENCPACGKEKHIEETCKCRL